ncbi:Fis family transcriptional regulator [Vibrio kyushuensis]|uniref:Fis family transcriptional regulator n=1 Tax=Vibrio kyushuensis TaxID=2910249 RepID=UPI003D1234E8
MRKTDKKIDNQLRVILTDVCDTAIEEHPGFQWLTHTVNYASFPKSLKIICIFDTNEQLSTFTIKGDEKVLTALIHQKLASIGVSFKNTAEHISYDTEENCTSDHNGNWAKRLG